MKSKKNKVSQSWLLEDFWKDYVKNPKEIFKIHKIHKKGFTFNDWNILDLANKNYTEYLTTIAYYAMHPLNKDYSKWIDDKLTLKYLCAGTKLDQYMPKYYAQIDEQGIIHKLMDYEEKNNTDILKPEDIAILLKNNHKLAIKLIAGSIGEGFYYAEYKENFYYMNSIKMKEEEFCHKIRSLKNYLITEYFETTAEFKKYSSQSVNCLRYLAGRIGPNLMFIKSYIRFGTKKSGFVENYNCGGILCFLDEEGNYMYGNIIENGKNKKIFYHTDTNTELKGKIPKWAEIQTAVQEFGNYFPQLNYLGFDFVLTNKNEVKILEINSLTSLDALQLDKSMLKHEFFQTRINN